MEHINLKDKYLKLGEKLSRATDIPDELSFIQAVRDQIISFSDNIAKGMDKFTELEEPLELSGEHKYHRNRLMLKDVESSIRIKYKFRGPVIGYESQILWEEIGERVNIEVHSYVYGDRVFVNGLELDVGKFIVEESKIQKQVELLVKFIDNVTAFDLANAKDDLLNNLEELKESNS